MLDVIADVSVDEGSPWTLTVSASDPDLPANQLTFSVAEGAPPALQINPASGEITWRATETDGPGSYEVTVVVTDDGTPARSDEQTLTLTVREVNLAPGLVNIADQSVDEGATLTLTAKAIDPDQPAQVADLQPRRGRAGRRGD